MTKTDWWILEDGTDVRRPRYRWHSEGMVLDPKGAYVLAHMCPPPDVEHHHLTDAVRQFAETELDQFQKMIVETQYGPVYVDISMRPDALGDLLPTFEVGQVVGELQPGRRRHDWCSMHGDIGSMESIDAHARRMHGSSAEQIRKAQKVIKRALLQASK